MFRSRRISMSLVLVALLALSLGHATAAPKPQNKGQGKSTKARISWSVRRIVQPLAPGQAATATVELRSSMDLNDVVLHVPGGLSSVVTTTPATGARFSLKANTPMQITLRFVIPADAVGGQGGVVQVRVGQHNMPAALHVFVGMPEPSDADDQVRPSEGAGAAKNKQKGRSK